MSTDTPQPADAAEHAEFRAFLTNMPVKLRTFVDIELPDTITVEDGGEKEFVKDFSPGSLPWVEAYALTRLPGPSALAMPENQTFSEGVMRYVGETFLRAVGGEWDFDPRGVGGHGMPFIRPDSAAGQAQGEPVSVVGLLLTALEQRRAEVFVTALARTLAGFGEGGMPPRRSTGLEPAGASADRPSQSEQEFLDTFLGTVEPAVAAWVGDQANPGEWQFDRASLARLERQLRARFDDAAELSAEREQFFIAGAVRFVGEVLRRAGSGSWRYGAELEPDDPRAGQPFVRISTTADAEGSTRSADFVPWQLLRRTFTGDGALTAAYDHAVAAAGQAGRTGGS
ncbi:hypothetical protein GCM10022261_20520 [Brevibacterium daeguense]|uniref:Uncharacterized protein n=1 Tax=Brevibacterium daeguense TaxID=909936 RepID=A0ABP8EKQ4_9MICO|nr:hypothetical protein [Brevibacterium daeguense]